MLHFPIYLRVHNGPKLSHNVECRGIFLALLLTAYSTVSNLVRARTVRISEAGGEATVQHVAIYRSGYYWVKWLVCHAARLPTLPQTWLLALVLFCSLLRCIFVSGAASHP